jgi:Ni,Fe-hydrogenase maturation factor
MKKASIIALGDILQGDLGIGCHLLDALGQEGLDPSVDLYFVGEDVCFYQADFSIVVQGLELGAPPGTVQCWTWDRYLRNSTWLAECSATMRALGHALARAQFTGWLPRDLLFMWIEPFCTEGLRLSWEGRRALRLAIQTTQKNLLDRNFLELDAMRLPVIHRLPVLGITV